jgi:hypothetical protein
MQQKAHTRLWYAKFKSIVCVKYEFRYVYGVTRRALGVGTSNIEIGTVEKIHSAMRYSRS